MNLTKEKITTIDVYLKENGVKYWDVRIELIDHVASKLEDNPEIILNKTFLIKEFGTNISLNKVIDKKTTLLIKKYRKLHYKEAIQLFKSPIKILGVFTFIVLYYLIFSKFNTKFFIRISFILFYLPFLVSLLISAYNSIKKNKSVHIESSLNFILLGIILINPLLINIKSDAHFNQKLTLFILLTLHTVWIFSGYKVYLKTFKEYSKIHQMT
ncbi:MAG: hypothetical protein L3J34_12145 [Flavobacteriaceae bacterium]|nr:hypothetical protein [Flavobacteriaceae bacterium]